jgi:hypothetical protein
VLECASERGAIQVNAAFIHVLAERLCPDYLLTKGEDENVRTFLITPPGTSTHAASDQVLACTGASVNPGGVAHHPPLQTASVGALCSVPFP